MLKTNKEKVIDPIEKAGLPTSPAPGGFRRGMGLGRRRILGMEGQSNCYHVMSRTAGGEMLFGDVEKEAFVRIMRRLERFAGVEVLTFAVMSNHFHLLAGCRIGQSSCVASRGRRARRSCWNT